ncbi:hypothetical protein Tsubulata_012949 [Turnera subulata]|uniref:PRA1 family protein n=1 Tax=Turnera subulata TaxID=218843 RepID=A0A9Q0JQN6_9ROSI|nr:hypothetical protein Tsubulata_012949 [Turnera subulata]
MPPQTQSTSPGGERSYISIPISAGGVLSRSLHNLSTAISTSLRPWPELIACSSGRGRSCSSFVANFDYFRTNYAIITCACGAFSLMGSPASLLVFASLSSLWLLLHFFREDPLLLWGYHIADRFLSFGLLFLSFLGVWFCGSSLGDLLLGLLVGLFLCALHALLRDPPPLLQQQQEPLMGSGHDYGSYGAVTV